jgi:hypothetical protein
MSRAFIVGNGPSLNNTNLDLLIGETSFGVNRIAGIYPKTRWRPTHYVRAEEASTLYDPTIYQSDMEIHRDLKCEIWANEMFIREADGIRKSGQYRQIRGCAHYNMHFDNPDCPASYHLPRLCTFGSSVNVAIQIALGIMNIDTVYLVGCDMGYRAGAVNHFDENYTNGVGELRDARYNELDILAAHMIAARSFPGRIFNATVGGSLEVYERVSFESLFLESITPVLRYT